MSKYEYKVKGANYTVDIQEIEGKIAKVLVNDIPFEVELINGTTVKQLKQVEIVAPKVSAPVAVPKPTAPAEAPAVAAAAPTGAGTPTKAPLPGTITSINVAVGQTVNKGDIVVVLEAMKMQNDIEAENSGTVTAVCVKQGDTVQEDTVLVTIA